MNISGRSWKTIWLNEEEPSVGVIDQTKLPHFFRTCSLKSCEDVVCAINNMTVRGAPLIGVAAAYGLMLAIFDNPSDNSLNISSSKLISTRPTAVNLRWSIERILKRVIPLPLEKRAKAAMDEAKLIEAEDINLCQSIGNNGLKIIKDLIIKKEQNLSKETINILTHCNAGWLATVDWGTALAPVYKAHREGINVHVWVDETRPRNQGTNLTSYELGSEGIPHTLIVDNAGGHLMQNGLVDAVFVGADRITKSGDVCNKIGTYLKALAAKANNIPFYVAAPYSTLDFSKSNGLDEIIIENRSSREITHIEGKRTNSEIIEIKLAQSSAKAFNPSFDITPSHLVSALITERGITEASEKGLSNLYPDLN